MIKVRFYLLYILILIFFLVPGGCFHYERKYAKDIVIYTPLKPPDYPRRWAVGPEGSKAHQLALKILEREKLKILPLVTKGSLDSLEKIANGQALSATVRADHVMLSYRGNNQQVRADATRVVSALRPLLVYVLLKKDLGERSSFLTLPAGATIITDPLWEGGSFIARQFLRACDKNPDQFEFEEILFSEWDKTIQKENVLAVVLTASIGDERIKGILESGFFRLVSFPLDKMGVLLGNHPYFSPFRMPQNTFPHQSEPILTVMLKNLLLVRVDYPAEEVQKFCEDFFPSLKNYNQKKEEVFGLSNALQGVPIPIHQGALRYYRSRCEFFTGDPLGTYYDLGIDLSSFFNRLLGPVILPRKSSGSIENINAIEHLYGQLAIVQSDIAYKSLIEKSLTVPNAPHLRSVAALFPENMHIVVRKKDTITALSDLVGKKISLGELGSGTMLNAVEILKTAGIYPHLKKEDLLFLNRKQLLPALEQGTIDGFFQMSADPSGFLTDIFRSGKYYFLSLSEDVTDELVKTYPYYLSGIIPEGCYPHQKFSINTISTVALLVTHKDADSDLIKKVVTLLGEHIREISDQHSLLSGISISQLWTRSSIPFHEIVPNVVSRKGWPISQPDVSVDVETVVNLSQSDDSSGIGLSKQEVKDLVYPEETIITEEAINREATYLEEGKERRFMSLQEATLLALRENLSIAVEANTPLLKQLDIAIEKAQFYPHLLIDAERTVESERKVARSDRTSVEMAIEEKLPGGATIKVGSDWITWDDNKTSRTYQFSSFFEMTQPLLEGMGIEINMADYYISRESAEISLESFRNQLMETLTEVRTQYYELLRAFQLLGIRQQTLELARQQLNRTAALVQIGKVQESELTIAVAQVSRRENDVIVAKKNFRDQEDILLELLHARYGYYIDPVLKLPIGEREFRPVEPFTEDVMRIALTKRPDVRNALANLEIASIEERVAKNAVLPGLDLKAKVFNDSNVWERSYQTFKAFEDYNDITFSLGFSLDIPVPNTEDRSAFVQAQINRHERLLELEQLKEKVQKEVRESVRRVRSDEERVVVAKRSLTDTEEQLAQQILKFKDGESDNFNVFNSLSHFTEAQLTELNALVDYYQAVINQVQVLGVTDEKLNIRVYNTLKTNPWFKNAFSKGEQKELEMRE